MREAFLSAPGMAGEGFRGKVCSAMAGWGYNPTAAVIHGRNVMDEVAAVVGETTGLGQVERVVNLFVAPAKTFMDILRSRSWWLPFLLTVVATVGVTVAIQEKVGWERVVETQVEMSPSIQTDGLALRGV